MNRSKTPRVSSYETVATLANSSEGFNPKKPHFTAEEKERIRHELRRLREQENQLQILCRSQY